MKKAWPLIVISLSLAVLAACETSYKAQPVAFKAPEASPNAVKAGEAVVVARAFVEAEEARAAFGFDVRGAGMLPVQVIFDNKGTHPLEINPGQTFLEDNENSLWPVLTNQFAYERATKYAKTKQIFKEGAYNAFLGATAGAVIGAAVGVVAGGSFGEAVGKGAAVGGAAGAVLGGTGAHGSDEARQRIMEDFREKSLKNRTVEPQSLAHGFIFFPGEAASAKLLRLQIKEKDTNKIYNLLLPL